MELLDALDVAVAEFRARLATVGAQDWTLPTPCDEWDVRFLAAHVVGGHLFASQVLDGQSADDAIAALMSAPVLGDDPLRRHDELAAAERRGFRRPGRLDEVVDHPAGTITGAEFLAMRVFDVTVHTWDLARATGGNEQLDSALAARTLEAIIALERGPGFGIAATGACTDDDPALVRLLDLSGRRS